MRPQQTTFASKPGVAFDSSGTRLFVVYPAGGPAFPKGRLEEYDVGDDSWVSVACGAVDRPFTDLEWATFGPSDEPKPTDLC